MQHDHAGHVKRAFVLALILIHPLCSLLNMRDISQSGSITKKTMRESFAPLINPLLSPRCLLTLLTTAGAWAWFTLALSTSLGPQRHLVLQLGVGNIALAGVGGALIVALMVGLHWGFIKIGHPTPTTATCNSLFPILALSIPGIHAHILHPMGLPLEASWLLLPALVMTVTGILIFWSIIQQTLQSSFGTHIRNQLKGYRLAYFIAPLLIVIVGIVYGAASDIDSRRNLLVGDEPHYLLIMESIQKYHSAELTEVLNAESYGDGVRRVRAHRTEQSKPGKTYSVHHLGLPLLMAPIHAIGGYPGVILFFAMVSVLLIANIYLYTKEITGKDLSAFFISLILAFTCPVVFYFRSIYPDVMASCLLLYAYRHLCLRKKTGAISFIIATAAAAYLPWLHVKYILPAVTLIALHVLQYRIDKQWKINWTRIAVIALCFGASAIPMAIYFKLAFGSIMPNAQYGSHESPLSAFFWRGAPGLLFDRDHGLLAFSPFLLLAIAGLPALWKRNKQDMIQVAILTLPAFAIVASHWMWWGGPCPPARFIMPLVPFLGPALVYGFELGRKRFWRPIITTAVAISLLFGIMGLAMPGRLTIHHHIGDRLFLGMKGFPCLPHFFIHYSTTVPASSYMLLAIWLIISILILASGIMFFKRCSAQNQAKAPHWHHALALLLGALVALLGPGLLSVAATRLTNGDERVFDSQRLLARIGFFSERLSPPLRNRSPILTVKSANNNTSEQQFSIHIPHSEHGVIELGAVPAPHCIMSGPYTTLYPAKYTITFILTANGPLGNAIGHVDISAESGTVVLEEKPIISDKSGNEQQVTLTFSPDKTYNNAEFRCWITGQGAIQMHGINITADLTQIDER